MSGWLVLLALLAASLLLLRLLGLRAGLLQFVAAALLFGAAGYAWQGRPGLAGANADQVAKTPPIPLTRLRHAFYGEFTGSESWLRMSEGLAGRGNLADASGILQTAVRRHPDDPQLWVGLGNALVDQAGVMTPPAELAYGRAIELTPDYPAPRFFLGLALARSGNRNGALLLWRSVLADAPADASWRPLVEDAIATLDRPQAGS
jgi:cytochrome c-type biogenesis protein CcmH/NrfG